MRAFDRLRLWNRVRVAVSLVLRENDPAAVENLLRQDPAAGRDIARRARTMADVFPLHALLLAVGMARCGAAETIDLLRWLVGREYGWSLLEEEGLRDLRRYLAGRGEMELLDAVRQRLDDRQLAWVLPDVGAADFLAELARLRGEHALPSIARSIADFIEDVEFCEQPAGHWFDNATAVAAMLWNGDRVEEALQLWTLMAITEPELCEDANWLAPIVTALPGWIPGPEPVRIEDLPREVQMATPVPPRVVRAADLLTEFPRREWIEPLRRAWLAVEDLVRRDAHDEQHERNPQRLMAAQAIGAALGACAARDRQMQVLVHDEAGRKHRHEALGRQVERRNQLVDRYNKLVAEYHKGKDLVDAIRRQKDEIGKHDERIARAREALREDLNPAALLLHAVSDGQSYPLEVRQGAAWGLHCIVKNGALNEEARERVRKTLQAVLHDQELDESAVRARIATVLPDGDVRIRQLLNAAERYAADHDAAELDATVRRLAPEIPSLAREVRDSVDESLQSRFRGDFGERMLRILPGSRLLELAGSLRRGLRWMVELVEGRSGGDPALAENLPWIVALVGEQMPDVMDFLSRYPLRLMTLHRHRQILGQYSRDKVHLRFWTRYTPPRWFRGANPSELGEVHHRYLELDDRSAPNAMGLYYRLFEHPVLVLPVLYHEFLHYGGPEGDPKQGIDNETEVLFREVFFARHLLARLAPDSDDELPAYETALAAAIERSELVGLAQQLFYELEDDVFLSAINEQIAQIYGEGLDANAARAEVDRRVEHWNRTIALENQTDEAKLSWGPEVDWPQLGTAVTRALTHDFRTVLSQALQQHHRLAAERRDAVLSEPVCRRHREAWSAYRRRPGALAEFSRRFARRGLDRAVLQAIARRFDIEDSGVPLSEVLRLLRGLAFTADREPS
jgi:hypothetical protein